MHCTVNKFLFYALYQVAVVDVISTSPYKTDTDVVLDCHVHHEVDLHILVLTLIVERIGQVDLHTELAYLVAADFKVGSEFQFLVAASYDDSLVQIREQRWEEDMRFLSDHQVLPCNVGLDLQLAFGGLLLLVEVNEEHSKFIFRIAIQ